jgi:hypothetical protein
VANSWLAATTWPQTQTALTAAAAIPTPERRPSFALLRFLFPQTAEQLDQLDQLLDAAEKYGLDTLLADLGQTARHREAVQAWVATPSWTASRQALEAAPGLAEDPRTTQLLTALAESDDTDQNTRAIARQHLAILDLIRKAGLDHAYSIVTDLDAAAGAAWQATVDADEPHLTTILAAEPDLLDQPFVGPALVAILLLLRPQPEPTSGEPTDRPGMTPTPTMLITLAAEQGTGTQCQALSNRLRRITRHRPDLSPDIQDLLPLLDPQ